jgi:plasmid maintenance system antidote protein VapI
MKISEIELATEINVPLPIIEDIIQASKNITANIAFWLNFKCVMT